LSRVLDGKFQRKGVKHFDRYVVSSAFKFATDTQRRNAIVTTSPIYDHDSAAAADDMLSIHLAVMQIDERARVAWMLLVAYELNLQEVCILTNESDQTVELLVAEANARLRELLA